MGASSSPSLLATSPERCPKLVLVAECFVMVLVMIVRYLFRIEWQNCRRKIIELSQRV